MNDTIAYVDVVAFKLSKEDERMFLQVTVQVITLKKKKLKESLLKYLGKNLFHCLCFSLDCVAEIPSYGQNTWTYSCLISFLLTRKALLQ